MYGECVVAVAIVAIVARQTAPFKRGVRAAYGKTVMRSGGRVALCRVIRLLDTCCQAKGQTVLAKRSCQIAVERLESDRFCQIRPLSVVCSLNPWHVYTVCQY